MSLRQDCLRICPRAFNEPAADTTQLQFTYAVIIITDVQVPINKL